MMPAHISRRPPLPRVNWLALGVVVLVEVLVLVLGGLS